MKNEIKKGQVITRGFTCCSDTVVTYEAQSDVEEGKFVKLAHFRYYKDANEDLKMHYTGEVIKKKVKFWRGEVYISF
jgi:hypothetical protein